MSFKDISFIQLLRQIFLGGAELFMHILVKGTMRNISVKLF